MKRNLNQFVETLCCSVLVSMLLVATCWAAPPPPPLNLLIIPVTPVGNAEVSAMTVLAVAAYGYWRSRK